MALRDAGAEVIYLGLRRSPEEIVRAARDEGADVIGLSVLSGAHLALCAQIVEERAAMDCEHIAIVLGGTIPDADVAVLLESGIAAVFSVGSDISELVDAIIGLGVSA